MNAREPKIVNGPEILDKYVGQSEANIRLLFADAEEEERRVSQIIFMFFFLPFFFPNYLLFIERKQEGTFY